MLRILYYYLFRRLKMLTMTLDVRNCNLIFVFFFKETYVSGLESTRWIYETNIFEIHYFFII